jgi:hypothetical protein
MIGEVVLSWSTKTKAAALRRAKMQKRMRELVAEMRKREPRRTILDPVEYDVSQATGVPGALANPALERLLRRQS